MRGPQHKELEENLLEWFHQMREGNIPVSGPVIKQKADYFALQLQVDDFKCSNGWLQRFTQRNNLVYKTVCGESAAVYKDAAVSRLDSVQPVVSKYAPCDIFNMEETGFSPPPNKPFITFRGENCHNCKHSKARITVLLCCNQDGSMKLRPLVVGKSKNPRVSITFYCPVIIANENAGKMATLNTNVVLLLDCCAAHTAHGLQLNNVTLMFLPANTTSIMQPLDQGIIHTVKRLYRSRLANLNSRNVLSQSGSAEEEILDLEEGWEELKQHGASGDFVEYVHIDDAVSTKAAPLTDYDRELDNIIPVATC
ncbi:hypothetical protein PR048_006082 [Dryococelus australis]|uniref:HTH CENPB-type domain-containing protein n=1 Tax=Dryococelus australis TaxID=614101 RepID=A0ABQ9IB20_9NEOP|nr:hypothetical protein PR048_006082 [Dryococelus australis]